ncbi:hypothetical protein GJ688_13170 [Heliobacillus mobilis]|uniref:FlgN protein n=1 Tax=Heliobacterium mobile TaxID=28064 RepID=A0A6I3SMG4_HELMO|nr:flagellar protein FlgN [Heliobacterium mobile]MTV49925.1 hypothetical protein [Heliobacterium mobile]
MTTREQVPRGFSLGGKSQEGLFRQLDELLALHHKLMQGLFLLAQSQEKAIMKSNIQEVQKITEAQNTLIFQTGQVELKRQKLCEEWIDALNFERSNKNLQALTKHATLNELIPYIPLEYQLDIRKRMDELQNLMKALKKQNARNEEMIHLSLDFLNQLQDMISQAVTNITPSYGPEGEKEAELLSIFNKRA